MRKCNLEGVETVEEGRVQYDGEEAETDDEIADVLSAMLKARMPKRNSEIDAKTVSILPRVRFMSCPILSYFCTG